MISHQTRSFLFIRRGLAATETAKKATRHISTFGYIEKSSQAIKHNDKAQAINKIKKYAKQYGVPESYAFACAYQETRYEGPLDLDYINQGIADLISFGQLFLANPDLPARLQSDGPFNTADPSKFYGGGEEGYTDYPTLN